MKLVYPALLGLLLVGACAHQTPVVSDKVNERIEAIKRGEVIIRELTPIEKKKMEDTVKEKLKDTDSAQFKWLPIAITKGQKVNPYCGYVNAKNSFGGYVGFAPYVVIVILDDKGMFDVGTTIAMGDGTPGSPSMLATRDSCLMRGYPISQ